MSLSCCGPRFAAQAPQQAQVNFGGQIGAQSPKAVGQGVKFGVLPPDGCGGCGIVGCGGCLLAIAGVVTAIVLLAKKAVGGLAGGAKKLAGG